MRAADVTPLRIAMAEGGGIPGLLLLPAAARACFVMAHGAGAGMTHPFLASMAGLLAERGVATLRYDFPYMARGSKRPDGPAVAQAAVRAAVHEAAARMPDAVLVAGGKSFGARMTSLAHAAEPLPVRGLVFIGFPLHPAGRPATQRAAHLAGIDAPMLFLQGTRDKLAETVLLQGVSDDLGSGASVTWIEGADHAFHVPARSGRTDDEVRAVLANRIVDWLDGILGG